MGAFNLNAALQLEKLAGSVDIDTIITFLFLWAQLTMEYAGGTGTWRRSLQARAAARNDQSLVASLAPNPTKIAPAVRSIQTRIWR